MPKVYDLNGKVKGEIKLPRIFSTKYRPDLIKRAVLALQSSKRQPYGSDPLAGFRTSAHYHGRRRIRFTMMMRDMARIPRLHGSSPHLAWKARRIVGTVKGRRAHPPKAEKILEQKINNKEMKLALRSVIAATANKNAIEERGHRIGEIKDLPLIVKDDVQSIKKTKDVEKMLKNLGLGEELERTKIKKIRAGKGKMRTRKYKRKIGPLIVVGEDKGIVKAGKNVPGVKVCGIKDLLVEDLAPGTHPGRLTIYSVSAIKELEGF